MTNTSRNRGIGIVTASDSQERSKGQLHIYDGEGKGKSQAALGVVLRTIGLGICEKRQSRVLLLRFLKGPERPYDEDSAIEALQRGFPHLHNAYDKPFQSKHQQVQSMKVRSCTSQ